VLAVNLEIEFRVSIFAQFLPSPPQSEPDAWIGWLLATFFEMKAFVLFSLLFGVGLAIQHERLAASDRRAVLLVRRMLVLLLFGLIHLLLIWNGDILTEYALASLIVLPFLYSVTRGLLAGATLFLALYLCLPLWAQLIPFPSTAALVHQVAAATTAYGTGGFAQVLDFSWRELPLMLPLHGYLFPRTIGLMLLGALSWRLGLFKQVGELRGWLWFAAAALIAAGAALALAGLAGGLSPVVMALGYAALVLALADGGPRWSTWVEPLGRMAFTNYVVQSIAMGFIFFGYGLGLSTARRSWQAVGGSAASASAPSSGCGAR